MKTCPHRHTFSFGLPPQPQARLSRVQPWPTPGRIRLAISLLLLCLACSGCLPYKPAGQSIAEPPLIPTPLGGVDTETPPPPAELLYYADMNEWEDRHYPAGLRAAIMHAIQLGVLKPSGTQERFEAKRTLSYNEFRQWALAYQNALYGYQALPSAEALVEVGIGKASTDGLAGPMSPEKLLILPDILEVSGHRVAPNQPLSREALCHLYFMLSKQTDQLALSPAEIEKLQPSTEEGSQDEAFFQFKDYAAIGDWAKPAVGLMYKNGQLQRLFRKNINQLTLEEGFGPQEPVTRAEAIVLFHWIYGHLRPNAPNLETQPTLSSPPSQKGPHSKLHLPDETGHPKTLPPPIGHLKTLTESAPNFKRTTFQISGPD